MTASAKRRSPLLVLAGLLLSSCGWGTMSQEEFQNQYGSLSLLPLVGQSLFHEGRAQAFLSFLERRLGKGVRLRSLTIYAAQAVFEGVTPSRPEEIDRYYYVDGSITHSTPVRLSGREDLDAQLFDPAAAGLEHLPAMIERTCAETRPGRGATPYASWRREKAELRVFVFCHSPRRSGGHLIFDVEGRLLEIQP